MLLDVIAINQGETHMAQELTGHPEYQSTIRRLEALKRSSRKGVEFWLAREIYPVLGYATWARFEAVVERAVGALKGNGIDPTDHIAQTSKLVGIGSGGERRVGDLFLSRAACRLMAMNGDPAKPEIAAAQAYFFVQTHRMELADAKTDDEKRLELRDKVAQSHRVVSGVAHQAGVRGNMQGVFHDARYKGLYGMSLREVKKRKGLGDKDQLYDFAGPLELSANDFQ